VVRRKIDPARETAYGVRLSARRDARDVESTDPNLEAVLTARMDEALAEGAAKASLKCELVESDAFKFGVTFGLGDRVAIRLAGAPVVTDTVRSVAFDWSPGDGVRVTPRVGEWSDSADAPLVKQVTALTRAVSNIEKR